MRHNKSLLTLVVILVFGPLQAADIAAMKAEGLAALGDEQFAAAAEIYRKVIAQDATDAEAHYRLGSALLSLEQDAAALQSFERAIAGGFQASAAQIRIAQIHARHGRTDGSVTDHKFHFTVFDNGDVRQAWEQSTDGGKTWSNLWGSRYVRKSKASSD